MTQEMIDKYPQIVPAKGETDTGVVISYECEDGNVTGSFILPTGQKMISIKLSKMLNYTLLKIKRRKKKLKLEIMQRA